MDGSAASDGTRLELVASEATATKVRTPGAPLDPDRQRAARLDLEGDQVITLPGVEESRSRPDLGDEQMQLLSVGADRPDGEVAGPLRAYSPMTSATSQFIVFMSARL